MRNTRKLARLLEAANSDARRGVKRIREYYEFPNRARVLCESAKQYEFWDAFSGMLGEMRGTSHWRSRSAFDEISIRSLFEEFIPDGREMVDSWNPKNGDGGVDFSRVMRLLEDAGANTADQFSNITGQIVYNRILQAYEAEEYVFSKIIPNIPTPFNGEKIAGISRIGDEAVVVPEGRPYPLVGVAEDYIQTPSTLKRGMIDALTKEAVFFDRTGVLLQRCGEVGEFLGLNKEERLIDAVIDQNTTAHRYNWKGTIYASYQSSTPWINIQTSNGLTDWTNVDSVEQTMASITDPFTGKPIFIQMKDIICTRSKLYTARRIVTATEIEVVTPGFATSANPTKTATPNPIQGYRIISSQLLGSRMSTASEAATDWFIGDVARAVNYMENFPLTVVQAPPNMEADFNRDVVMQWKASERGATAVVDPRALGKSTA